MSEITESCHETDCRYEDQIIRLRKIEGQVKGVQKMIRADRYCVDILTQIKSIKHALVRVEENILKRHIETCVRDAMRSGSQGDIDIKVTELMEVISRTT